MSGGLTSNSKIDTSLSGFMLIGGRVPLYIQDGQRQDASKPTADQSLQPFWSLWRMDRTIKEAVRSSSFGQTSVILQNSKWLDSSGVHGTGGLRARSANRIIYKSRAGRGSEAYRTGRDGLQTKLYPKFAYRTSNYEENKWGNKCITFI